MLNSDQILAMSGVDLSPKLRDRIIYNNSSSKSRRNSYSRHSNGLSQSQDRIRFRSRLSPKRAPSAPRPSSSKNNYGEPQIVNPSGRVKRSQQNDIRSSSVGRLYSQRMHVRNNQRSSLQNAKLNLLYGMSNASR